MIRSWSAVTWTSRSGEGNSAEQHGERRSVERDVPALVGVAWQLEAAAFESLVEDGAAIAIPPQRLEAIAALIEKQEQVSVEHAAFKDEFHGGRESIEAFT